MGVIELLQVASSAIKRFRAAPGDSVIVKSVGLGGAGREDPLYQHHGFRSIPVNGTRGVRVLLGNGTREGIVIATENYTVNITLDDGETAIYSTDIDGVEQAVVKLRSDGSIELNGNSKRLVTYGELNTALQTLVGAINTTFASKLNGSGSPGALTLNIAAAETTTIKTGG